MRSVPFDIPAGQRQLFLDGHGMAKTENLRRKMHPPAKKGAVIRPDIAGEGDSYQIRAAPSWDERRQAYRLPVNGKSTWAWESKDGLRWACMGESTLRHYIVVYDTSEPDLERRYKTLRVFNDGSEGGVAVSPDLLTWSDLDIPSPPVPTTDEFNASFDEQEHLFIVTAKIGGPHGRSVGLLTSSDFITWEDHGLILHADDEDQELGVKNIEARLANPALQPFYWPPDPAVYNVDIYNMGVFRYEGLYLGTPALFHSVGKPPRYPNTEGFHLVQLACSRDLKTWQRLGDRKPFIGPSPLGSGAYDLTQILGPSSPLVRGDELWFYYTGLKYRGGLKWIGPDGEWTTGDGTWCDGRWEKMDDFHPDPDGGAICLATLRRDGFVSLSAGKKGGKLFTEPFKVRGRRLFVNIDASKGELRVAALGTDRKVLATSVPLAGDHRRAEVKWRKGNIADLKGKMVRLRFTLHNADFYSYWLE